MRRGEDTLIPNWALEAEEQLTLIADAKVFKRLVRFRHYRDNTYSTLQLAYTLEIDQRTIRASLERLRGKGLIVSHDGRHCSPEAASKLPPVQLKTNAMAAQEACKDAARVLQKDPAQNPKKGVLHDADSSLNKGIKEEKKKDINPSPLTPQGEVARHPTAPGDETPESPVFVPAMPAPDGEAADAAHLNLQHPAQVDSAPPAGEKKNATSKKNVPAARRGAASGQPTAHQELFAAVALACYGGHDDLTDITQKRVGKVARSLHAAKFTAEQVALVAQWLRTTQGWRDAITPSVIEDQAPVWRAEQRGSLPARSERPRHVLKFTPPQSTAQANQQFVDRMAANAEAVKGIFNE